jgi:hypothetical protein
MYLTLVAPQNAQVLHFAQNDNDFETYLRVE